MSMVKISESVQGREYEQTKLVDRLDQKVLREGEVSMVCTSIVHNLSGLLQAPSPILLLDTKRANPVVFSLGKCIARCTDRAAGQDAGTRKSCTVTVQIRAIARHESGLTSSGSLIARNSVESLTVRKSK